MTAPHTHFPKGSKVWVQLRDGQKFQAKFLQEKGNFVFFENRSKINKVEIRAMSYYRRNPRDV